MYTVLITAKKTSDNMQEHYPAIKDIVEADNIGLCQWIKSGTTIETALPELYGLVNKNREWRAVVVMYDEPDDRMESTVNPFDYGKPDVTGDYTDDKNSAVNFTLEESNEIDLIRLTHLLGGVPLPSREYESELYQEGGEIPYNEYKEVRKDEREDKEIEYGKWNAEHKMNGIMPSEIVLVRTRDITYRNDIEIIKQAWEDHNEFESSEFWRRNLYPQSCRFLIYNIEKRGMMYEERDSIRFWMAILTLASNDIDSNVMQPHKLYNLKVKIDSSKLTEIFQDTVKKLNMAKRKLVNSIASGDDLISERDDVPDYNIDVPVNFHNVNRSRSNGNISFEIGYTGGISSNEERNWNAYTIDTYLRADELIKSADRELEYVALKFRDKCEYTSSEVKVLDKFAEEDLTNDIRDTYAQILRDQKALPKGTLTYDEEMKQADAQVKTDISERMSKKQVLVGMVFSLVVLLAVLLPAFRQESSQNETITMLFLVLISVFAVTFVTLFFQRKALKNHVKQFRNYFNLMSSEMGKNARLYTSFLGDIASHIRGSSYIRLMNIKKKDIEKAVGIKKTHISFIDEFKSRLSLWSSALRLAVDMEALDETVLATDNSEVDFDRLYSICMKHSLRKIPLNESGLYINSPFNFVDALLIEREEVYDNV